MTFLDLSLLRENNWQPVQAGRYGTQVNIMWVDPVTRYQYTTKEALELLQKQEMEND